MAQSLWSLHEAPSLGLCFSVSQNVLARIANTWGRLPSIERFCSYNRPLNNSGLGNTLARRWKTRYDYSWPCASGGPHPRS